MAFGGYMHSLSQVHSSYFVDHVDLKWHVAFVQSEPMCHQMLDSDWSRCSLDHPSQK